MPLLDVVHLFFKATVTLEDAVSIFSKEWHMTLQYVLHQSGLNVAYTSRLSVQHDIWVFLVWENEDHRSHFYHQTTGFGFMSNHMEKSPLVFFFGDGSYEVLGETNRWTIHFISPEVERAQELEHVVSKEWTERLLKRHGFVARQEKEVFERLYEGNDFEVATVALHTTVNPNEKSPESMVEWSQYNVEIEVCEPQSYPTSEPVEAPMNVADLLQKQPWEYGLLSSDELKYSNSAYPMNLTFRPMSTLSAADKFLSERSKSVEILESDAAVSQENATAIVHLRTKTGIELGSNPTEVLRDLAGLQGEVEGLIEISLLQQAGHKDDVWFLAVWNTTADLTRYQERHTVSKDMKSLRIDSCTVIHAWINDTVGLQKLEWEHLPLTTDKQSYQEIEKILELVEFRFENVLTSTEKEAFMFRIFDFISTMSSCWSEDIDAEPVVRSKDPVWTEKTDSAPSCLVFLAWDGPEQRAAWLGNFMSHNFTWTGNIAYSLGLICSSVESVTFKMEKLPVRQSNDGTLKVDNDDTDSDWDMGF